MTFLAILDQYGILFYFRFFTKWPLALILDVQNSLLIAFLAISDRYTNLNFLQNVLKITFDCISGHFRSIGHFGCLKFTFDSNSGHFRSIQIYFFDKMATVGQTVPTLLSSYTLKATEPEQCL